MTLTLTLALTLTITLTLTLTPTLTLTLTPASRSPQQIARAPGRIPLELDGLETHCEG